MTERGGRGRGGDGWANRRSARDRRARSGTGPAKGTGPGAGKSAGKSAGTGGRPARGRTGRAPLGLATTRRAAILAIVVCALALSVTVPLRTYLSQRADVEVQEQRQAELRDEVARLEERKAQLSDPAQVQAEARSRLRYVMPGETPYMVQLPGDEAAQGNGAPTQPPETTQPWFQSLWNSLTGSGR